AIAGWFDSITKLNRSQFFVLDSKENTFIENLIKYASRIQQEAHSHQQSLFGEEIQAEIIKPVAPEAEEWGKLVKLNKEKEHIGIYMSAHPLDDYKLEIENFCNADLNVFDTLEEHRGQEFRVSGIVSLSEQKTTKNNRPYGKYVIEDYSTSYSFMLFSKDFINYNQLLQIGYCLQLTGKVQQRVYNENELEFKISNVTLLSSIKEELVNNIILDIPVSVINPEMIDEFFLLIERNKGKVNLKIKIYDEQNKIALDMFSRKFKIKLSDDFLNYLDEKQFIEYKID
nr:hypothetical protein [Bacteroidota bacterium]